MEDSKRAIYHLAGVQRDLWERPDPRFGKGGIVELSAPTADGVK